MAAGTLAGGDVNVFSGNSAFTIAALATLDLGRSTRPSPRWPAPAPSPTAAGRMPIDDGGDNTSTTFSGIIEDGASTTALIKTGTGT